MQYFTIGDGIGINQPNACTSVPANELHSFIPDWPPFVFEMARPIFQVYRLIFINGAFAQLGKDGFKLSPAFKQNFEGDGRIFLKPADEIKKQYGGTGS